MSEITTAIKITDEMLVLELLKAIEEGEISIKEIANFFESSDRTIQKKITNLGFKWSAKLMKYEHLGSKEYLVALSKLLVKDVFMKKATQPENSKTTSKQAIDEVSEPINVTDNEGDNVITSEVIIANEIAINNDDDFIFSGDRIDEILTGKKVAKKYVGFYAEKDVYDALNSIEGRVKSELINECIRMVFKRKGLL